MREPYQAHVEETRKQIEQLFLQRNELLGRVYQLERSIEFLERHVKSICDLEEKAAEHGEL